MQNAKKSSYEVFDRNKRGLVKNVNLNPKIEKKNGTRGLGGIGGVGGGTVRNPESVANRIYSTARAAAIKTSRRPRGIVRRKFFFIRRARATAARRVRRDNKRSSTKTRLYHIIIIYNIRVLGVLRTIGPF